jgi:XTP/dITP diphosphohydrolase
VIRLVIATRNLGKVKEIVRILDGLPVEVVSLADYPSVPEVEETGSTFAENAAIKALHVAKHTGEIALADDSGLEVDALGGKPGVYSSRFSGPGATDARNNKLLLEKLRDVLDEDRAARFRCAAALAISSGGVQLFDGTCEGQITREPRGKNGFGYDPLFYVPEYGKTMAELPPEIKNRISHRAKAMTAARSAIEELVA